MDEYNCQISEVKSSKELSLYDKQRIIEMNIESTTIVHTEAFHIQPYKEGKELKRTIPMKLPLNSYKICKFSLECLKNNNLISLNISSLESSFKKAFDNQIPIKENKEHKPNESYGNYILNNLDEYLCKLKNDKMISFSKKILQNSKLMSCFKHFKIKADFPLLHNSVDYFPSDFEDDFFKVFECLEKEVSDLRKLHEADSKVKNSLEKIGFIGFSDRVLISKKYLTEFVKNLLYKENNDNGDSKMKVIDNEKLKKKKKEIILNFSYEMNLNI